MAPDTLPFRQLSEAPPPRLDPSTAGRGVAALALAGVVGVSMVVWALLIALLVLGLRN